MTEFMSLVNGSRFGAYVIECRLGSGRMGEVYRARDEQLQRTVAIKVLLRTHRLEKAIGVRVFCRRRGQLRL